MDHARYPAPANVHSLMACGCASCEEEADRLGYDFAAMRRGVLALRQRLEQLTMAEVRALAAERPGLMDFLGLLAQDGAVLDWVQFRAHILAERMGEFRAAVQEVGGRDKTLAAMCFPPPQGCWAGIGTASGKRRRIFLQGGVRTEAW